MSSAVPLSSAMPPPDPAVGDPLDLEHQVCFALTVASRSIVAVYRPILEPLGLTHPQYLVMLALWSEAPLSGRDLAARLSLEPGTLSPLLKRLEVLGLVSRGRRAGDERALAVDLTPAGAALRARALDVPGRVVAALGLSLDELQELQTSLARLLTASRRALEAT